MKNLILFIFNLTMVVVVQAQSFQINSSISEGCTPLIVSFESSATNVATYAWDFGNGTTSNVASPSVLFAQTGSFNITLEVTKTTGQIESVNLANPIRVVDKPNPLFSTSKTEFCSGIPISFSNSTVGATRYFWDFGDNTSSTLENPIHAYASSGTYSITLVAYNELGCTSAIYKDQYLVINAIDDLDFTSDNTKTCLDDSEILFTSINTYSSLNWDFGDGLYGAGANINHVYEKSGKYTVSLSAVDNNGCTATISKSNYIEILDASTPIIAYSETNVCLGSSVLFENKSINSVDVNWLFSDGYTSNENSFVREFNTEGKFDLTFTLNDKNGCSSNLVKSQLITVLPAPAPIISISENEGCAPFTTVLTNNTLDVLTYGWEVNGQSYSGKSIRYTFNKSGVYEVKALMQQTSGCSRTVVLDSAITVFSSEIALTTDTYMGCIPLTSNFSFSKQNVTNIIWDFGNGESSTELNPMVVYNLKGSYDVSATFVNQYGCTQTLDLSEPIIANDNSITYANTDTIVTCESVNVFFNGSMGKDFWEWDFGDGFTSDEMNPSHPFGQVGDYNVSLKTNNQNGCETKIENYNIITVSKVTTSFISAIVDTTLGCPNFTVQFENQSIGASSHLWDFGDGISSVEPNPTLSFSTNGQILVNLTSRNTLGCTSKAAETIASPWIYCTMPGDPESGDDLPDSIFYYHHIIKMCSAPSQVKFANPRKDALKWLWDFGDGNKTNEYSPSHTYQNEGTYYVTLVSYYADGNVNTMKDFTEVIIKSPSIDFDYSTTATCNGFKINFINSNASTISWEWGFGDGTTSTEPNPEVEYAIEGVYQVRLNAIDTLGCEVQIVKNVIVGNPYIQFDYPESICAGESIAFNHNIEGYNQYEWNLGDGNIDNRPYPIHIYDTEGTYEITLKATNKDGCSVNFTLPNDVLVNKPVSVFEVIGSKKGCNELMVSFKNNSLDGTSWNWDFGNGETSTVKNPSQMFLAGKYDVSLITNKAGCHDTLTYRDLIIVDNLKADFTFVQNQICLPITVQFTNNSENALEWLWDFGDGSTSATENPVHTYFTNPPKEVKLTVSNKNACSVSIQKPILPVFETQFVVNEENACIPFIAKFSDTSMDAISWFWDFGDGENSILKSPEHVYKSKGEFTVILIAQSITGCYDTLTKVNLIKTQEVVSAFSSSISETTCAPLLIQFNNESIDGNKFYWDFGDGSFSNNISPIHVYTGVGQYDVQLIVENSIGCKDTLRILNFITSTGPTAKFTISDTVVCHPQSIQLTDSSSNTSKWKWFWGDGNASEDQHPEYTYNSPGKYEISVLVEDDKGCTQIVNDRWVNVIATPVAKFEIDDYNYCLPVTVNMTNTSTSLQNDIMEWEFGDSTSSSATNPGITYTKPGSYTITLNVTNEGYCSNTYQLEKSIMVYDTVGINEPDVFSLSVLNSNKIEVLNKPYTFNNFKFNIVYKRDIKSNLFIPSDTLWFNTNEKYDDYEVNTDEESYTYKIQSHMYCHNETPIDELNSYKSILLNKVKAELNRIENNIILNWTAYKGHNFNYYSIFRKPKDGLWAEIARLESNTLVYEETEDLCPDLYDYQIKAVNLDGKGYSSLSNVFQISPPKNVFLDQKVDIIRSSVEENKYAYTEWNEPEIGPDKVAYYEVYKSEDGYNFDIIDKVPKGITSYFDEYVDVQSQSYTYRIGVINTCEVVAKESNTGNTVLLQKQTQHYINNLKWNSYKGWEKGVKFYFLQRMDEYGQWQNIQELDSTKNELIIDLEKDGN